MARRKSSRSKSSSTNRRSGKRAFVRSVVFVGGFFYLLVGISLLARPEWFFENVGNFPPFNRHYMGDLGSFLIPLGAGLVIASQDPAKHRLLISIGVAASFIHAFNHWYEVLTGVLPPAAWFIDTLPLLVFAIIFLWALWQIRPRAYR